MDIKPVKELEGNRTELVYNNKIFKQNSVVRHFSVPKEKVDEFSKSVVLDKVAKIINGSSTAEIKEFIDYLTIFETYRQQNKRDV